MQSFTLEESLGFRAQVRNAFLPQYLGQYSGPWHLAQAIQGSPYHTTDLDAADTVFVYDYCYYIWWLAFVHSTGRVTREEATPGDMLLRGYHVRACHLPSGLHPPSSDARAACCHMQCRSCFPDAQNSMGDGHREGGLQHCEKQSQHAAALMTALTDSAQPGTAGAGADAALEAARRRGLRLL